MGLGVLLWPMYLLTELQVIIMQRGMRITLHAADAQLLRQNRLGVKGIIMPGVRQEEEAARRRRRR